MGAQTYNAALHPARGDHDLPLHHPRLPGGLRQPGHADPDRRPRRRLSAPEPLLLVALHDRRRSSCWTSLFTGGGPPDTGWTFYVPFSARTGTNVSLAVFGVFILGFSSILTGLNFVTTIHRLRAEGMTWGRTAAVYLVALRHRLDPDPGHADPRHHPGAGRAPSGCSAPACSTPPRGGDPIMYQHLFWIYSHPAVYIMILPAMGVISEIIPVFSRKPIFGYKMIAFSSLAIAAAGSLVWGHHMFTSGMSDTAVLVFSFLTFIVAIPSAIKVFNWVSTLYKGSISLEAAHALRPLLHPPLLHRRADRPDPRRGRHRRPCPRHPFRGRPFPLRHVRRHRLRLLRRHALLAAQVLRPHATPRDRPSSPGR